jgi:hypothetical protein
MFQVRVLVPPDGRIRTRWPGDGLPRIAHLATVGQSRRAQALQITTAPWPTASTTDDGNRDAHPLQTPPAAVAMAGIRPAWNAAA